MKDRSYPFTEITVADADNGGEIAVKTEICHCDGEGYFLRICAVRRWLVSGKVHERLISKSLSKDIRLWDYRKGFHNGTFSAIKNDQKVARIAFDEIEKIFNKLNVSNYE